MFEFKVSPLVYIVDEARVQQRICQLRWNWVLVVISSCYLFSGWTITLSTLYQYLTNPANTTCVRRACE